MHQISGPISHISSLASNLAHICIQMVNPYDLKASLDLSTDLRHDMGQTMEEDFTVLLETKHGNCTEWFLANLTEVGIKEPIIVIIRGDNGLWQMDNGHHRLQWALLNNVDVPVVFDDTGMDDDSHMEYYVTRPGVTANHETTAETMVDELVEETETYLSTAAEVIETIAPNPKARKKPGRHRA
jgi:hypothetical protein